MKKFTETQLRTTIKMIDWRILMTASHTINGFFVSGSWTTGLQIAGIALILNSLLYFLHERAWNWTQWNKKPEDAVLFYEGNSRSLIKIVTWIAVIIGSNFFIPFILTGSFGVAAMYVGVATVVNQIIYFVHERIWNRITWGKAIKQ